MGPYELGVTNAVWQKAFTPEWETPEDRLKEK